MITLLLPLTLSLLPFAAPLSTRDDAPPAPHPALAAVRAELRPTMEWLLAAMPAADRATLDAAFLATHVEAAWNAWQSAPWRAQVDEELFRDALLPYASVSETRELWLPKLREICLPLVAGVTEPGVAAVRLNQQLFAKVNVRYSTERRRADQSPSESIESGLASCTGLSILLIDACRSIGVPARFVGVPKWADDSGNHSWVEVWDGSQWRFTGAAEPAGDALDAGWFTGRAAGQSHEPQDHAIWAVTWRDVPTEFPMVFDRRRPRARAVDVTDRYLAAAPPLPAGHGRAHVALLAADGKRVARELVVRDDAGREVARATSKDERFDLNDHLVLQLPLGGDYAVEVDGVKLGSVTVVAGATAAVPTFRFTVPAAVPTAAHAPAPADSVLAELDAFLRDHPLEEVAAQPFAARALGKSEVAPIAARLVAAHAAHVRERDRSDFDARIVTAAGVTMKYAFTVFGEKPANGRSLWISLHGGGGAPARVNDSQWENQKRLYQPAEGLYLAPRAPTDTWNLWHQGHIDPLFTKLIEQLVVFAEVDPDRVYVLGYSAGGDGVYQLAPRMADRFAAAAMMAGHPNETRPDGLRNLPFTLHMGGEDHAYDRANIGRRWKTLLAELAAADPGGYPHEVVIHEGKGHWMDREDAVALPWMAKHARQRQPDRIVWLQDDVTHERFYWLANPAPQAGARVVVTRAAQEVVIEEASGVTQLAVRVDDERFDLDRPVRVRASAALGGGVLFEGVVARTTAMLVRTLLERGDPRGLSCGEVTVELPGPPR